MTARLTQAEVDKWLAANRPDFAVEPDWVYVNNKAPIPGSCLVCGAKCSPMLHNMKTYGLGSLQPLRQACKARAW